ncbi:MAG: hypothetical protein MJZ53_01330 [Paludibacteraceae bacterium]|nr:hypothetical protein [Paludibacteraceae bacterium]
MKENSFEPSTFIGLVHPKSTAIRVMENLSVNACVQLYIPSGTAEQRENLDDIIHDNVLCRVPLRIGRRQFIYCRYNPDFTDDCILSSYTAALQAVFGSDTRAHARIYRKGGEL